MILVTVAELAVFFGYMYILAQQQAQGFLQQSMAIMLIIMAVFIAPNRWIYSTVSAVVVVGFFLLIAPTYIRNIEFFVYTEAVVYLFVCLVFSIGFSYSRSHTKHLEYVNLKKYENLSESDSLTELTNRARFEILAQGNIDAVVAGRISTFSLLLFDLDDFKAVNDKYGHRVGDIVLKELAVLVRGKVRDRDLFARWGGEEFVLLFPDASLMAGVAMAERIRSACDAYEFSEAGNVTISVGAVVYRDGDTVSSLVERADKMMYEAKRRGKNNVVSCE